MSYLFGLIAFMQYGANIFMFNVRIPAGAALFVASLAKIAAFDYYDTDDLFDDIFAFGES